jgi:hypothetical protein
LPEAPSLYEQLVPDHQTLSIARKKSELLRLLDDQNMSFPFTLRDMRDGHLEDGEGLHAGMPFIYCLI